MGHEDDAVVWWEQWCGGVSCYLTSTMNGLRATSMARVDDGNNNNNNINDDGYQKRKKWQRG